MVNAVVPFHPSPQCGIGADAHNVGRLAILHTIPRCGTLEKSSVALGDGRGAAKALKAQGVHLA